MRYRDWRLRILIVLGLVATVSLLVLGVILLIKGGHKAHVFSGVGLDRHWRSASPESLLIVGAILIWVAREAAQVTGRLRRHLSRRGNQTGGTGVATLQAPGSGG